MAEDTPEKENPNRAIARQVAGFYRTGLVYEAQKGETLQHAAAETITRAKQATAFYNRVEAVTLKFNDVSIPVIADDKPQDIEAEVMKLQKKQLEAKLKP